MKHLLFFLYLFTFSTHALAGGLNHNEGDKSLNFNFNEFDVDGYKYGIGGKYWYASNTAITASLNIAKNEQEVESTMGGPPPIGFEAETTTYGLSLSIEKHFQSRTSVSPYYGGEVYYSESDSDGSSSSSISTSDSQAWGINALLGVEYAFTDSLAFAAEYAWGYHTGESEYTDSTGTSKNSSKGFGFFDTKLILLLYF